MATETRPGFRLPWAAGVGETEDPSATGDESVAEEAQAPDMIETAGTSEPADASQSTDEPRAPATQPARRPTKFMADLSHAMQVAAENARSETMARFDVEAKGVVEEIHAKATDEAADLRRKADDDVAADRDRTKAEIARIREETEARIAARKSALDGEMEQHAATVESRVERVAAVVATFETQMSAFFDRLNAEEDPTRIATMAETMPDSPSLADVAASINGTPAKSAPEASTDPSVELSNTASDSKATAEVDFAAAEAEAAAFTGDLDGEDAELIAAEGVEPETEAPEGPAGPEGEPAANADRTSTRVIVSGLVSVANIANFKRSLSRTSGISTIGVASGPEGDFIFTVGHTLGAGLSASVQALPGFDIQLTGESDDAINVAAQDRDATD
jgi:hypothetical protein